MSFMSFRITTRDMGALAGLDRLSQRLASGPKEVLEAGRKAGEEMALQRVPVRTGYLRSTIYSEINDNSVELGAKAHYTVPVENLYSNWYSP